MSSQPVNLFHEDLFALEWELGYHKDAGLSPDTWMPAAVPGAVQLDVMKAENYKQPYWYGDNCKQFDWMEDYFFTYRTAFKKPDLEADQRLFFHSKGIDYSYEIYFNGVFLYAHEGMFSYVDLDLTDRLQELNELKVLILPVPKIGGVEFVPGTDTYRQNARESAKPAVGYGWDWHPRLVTRGIWDDTCLLVKNRSHLKNVSISYTLNDTFTYAEISVVIEGLAIAGSSYTWMLEDKWGHILLERRGEFTADEKTISATLENPELWWPEGYGEPILYRSELTLFGTDNEPIDGRSSKLGFRKVSMVMNEGEWDKPTVFPTSRNRAPACLEINGRRIFAKGTNWVHPEIFPGLITTEIYRKHIELAKGAHFNLLRVWGGGITNKEAFFDLCDELGLLVWQEFPLACNNYPDKQSYLYVLEKEATSIINRIKQHACLAIWSGGNELFNAWGGMTEQSLALRLLNSLCYQLDSQTPFIFTSPLYGMGHGSYLFFDSKTGQEVLQWMPASDKTAYTEFGVPGLANLDVLKSFIPEDELFPPKRGTAWELHHAFGAWRHDSWLELPFLEAYFGEISSLENLVDFSQLTQAEGLKFIYEEARRQRPYCSMALNWCFQEPWPTAANNSLINWPDTLKPAYYEVANACRPVLASLRARKFVWHEGEQFKAELFMLNDTYQAVEPKQVKVFLNADGQDMHLTSWDFPGSEGFKNAVGPLLEVNLPAMQNARFRIRVEVLGEVELSSEYVFLFKAKDAAHTGYFRD